MENIHKNKNAAENKIIKNKIAEKLVIFSTDLYSLSDKSTTKKELLDGLSTYILHLLDLLVHSNHEEEVRMKINNIIYKLVKIKGPPIINSSSVNNNANNAKKATMIKNIKDYSRELYEESVMLQGKSNFYNKYGTKINLYSYKMVPDAK